jgi:hypothetical protein
MELALPARPSPEQLAEFQHGAARPAQYGISTGYVLNRVHSMFVPRDIYSANALWLEAAEALLASEAGRYVEELYVPLDPPEHTEAVGRLIDLLPPTCRRLGLDLCASIDDAIALELLARVPEHVRELRLEAHGIRLARLPLGGLAAWIDDRFDAIELRFTRSTFDVALGQFEMIAPQIIDRLETQRTVRVQWTAVPAPVPERTYVGRPGDAAIVDLVQRHAMVLSRWSSAGVQDEHGRLPVRAQLAADRDETHDVFLYTTSADEVGALHSASVELCRRRDAWTVKRTRAYDSDVVVRVDGDVLGETPMPIGDGSSIATEHWRYAFITDDVTPTVRGLLSAP